MKRVSATLLILLYYFAQNVLSQTSTQPSNSSTMDPKKMMDVDAASEAAMMDTTTEMLTSTSAPTSTAAISEEACDSIYLRLNANHTACKDFNPVCNMTKIGVTIDERKEILMMHNGLRDRIASGAEKKRFKFSSASNMMKLEWDDELAAVAQAHANQCDFNHDCNTCREVDNFPVGQNLYQRRTSWLNPKANWTKAIVSFYEELSFTPLKVMSKFKGGKYGHFTQVVWAKTWKIGCGYSAYRIKEPPFRVEELYVCNYGPSGNIRNQRVYYRGKPSVRCPVNTSPSLEYTSLCEADDPRGPLEIDTEAVKASNRTLFFCDFSNDDLCGFKVSHQNNSYLVKYISGNYLSFILNPGQEVVLNLNKTIKAKKGFCVHMNQRKGVQIDGGDVKNNLVMTLKIPEVNWFTEVEFGRNSIEWVESSTDVNWAYETMIRIKFQVPEDAVEPQFYEIKNVRIHEGKCSQ